MSDHCDGSQHEWKLPSRLYTEAEVRERERLARLDEEKQHVDCHCGSRLLGPSQKCRKHERIVALERESKT